MDGLTFVFTVAVEVPAFSIAPLMLQRYGCGRMLLGAGVAYVIRVVGYTLIPYGKMYIVLMLELLHGVSYAGSKAGSVEFISRSIPEGREAAGQGINMDGCGGYSCNALGNGNKKCPKFWDKDDGPDMPHCGNFGRGRGCCSGRY